MSESTGNAPKSVTLTQSSPDTADVYVKTVTETAPLVRPNITPAQIVGMIPLVAEAAHAFGVFTMSQAQQDSLTKLVYGAIGLFGADAVIRLGRNLAHRL